MPASLAEYKNKIIRKIRKGLLLILILIPFSFDLSSQIYDIGTNNGQTINTCSGSFYDSGGSGSDYSNGETKTVTFCSDASNSIQFNFTGFATAPGDILYVYDGPDIASPLIGTYENGLAPFTILSSGTCLTFKFISDGSITFTGWEATISCICPPVIISLINPTNSVCEGMLVNYYVTNHAGSTYDWAVTNGSPSTVTAGPYNLDITWNVSGVDKLGIISVTEKNFCGSTASRFLFVNIYSIPTITGTTPGSVCGTGTVTLGATVSSGIVNWYDVPSGGSILGSGTTFITPSISSTTTYYAEGYNNGCISGARTPVIATVYTIPTITGTTPGSRCDAGTVDLSSTASAGTVNWYDASTGGSLLGTGSSFTTPVISTTTSYYVDATENGCTTGTRTDVIASVYTTPSITGSTPGSRCGNGTVTLGATSSAGTINWYDVSSGGSSLGTGISFTTPSISSTTTYYADATSVLGGCTSSPRTAVVATVHPIPSVSFTGLNTQYDLSDPSSILIGNPFGGTFTGPGISGITFTPSSAGIGTHTIEYTYSDAFCTNTASQNTEVSDYDFKSGAKLLTNIDAWCSVDGAFTTIGASGDEIKGSCWNNGPNYNRWFKFQATTTDISITLKTGGDEGTLRYPFVALFDDLNNELACGTYFSQYSDLTIGSTSLVPGNWYYISVDNSNNAGYRGTFTLCLSTTSDYDFKAGAIEIDDITNWCSADEAFTTVNASPDGNRGSCWNTGPNYNRWFKFQATTTDILVQMKTGGSEGTLRYGYMALWDDMNNEMACARYSYDYQDLTVSSTSLIVGQWYYISVDNLNNTAYRGTFSLCANNVVDYDFKAGAIQLGTLNNWCSADAAYTTVNASPDENKGLCWNSGPNYNRWFKFEATTTDILVQMKTGGTEGTLRYGYISLWDNADNELACARYSFDYQDLTISSNSLVPGQTYYISVDNLNNTSYQGTFSLCLNDEVDYDYKTGAIELNDISNWCSSEAEYTTVNASPDGNKGLCWNSGPNYNRWFKFEATTTDILIQMKTGGTDGTLRYGYISLWDNADNEIACARYSYDYQDLTISSNNLVPGQTYYISVDNLNNTAYQGTFSLCINDQIDYDFKEGAIELTDISDWCSLEAEYTTLNASPDGNKGLCWNSGPNYNRWFKFDATTTDILIQMKTGGTDGTLRYGYISLWDNADNEIACARYSYDYQDLIISSNILIPGQTYYISVDNLNNSAYQGTFSLCINDHVDYDYKTGAIELTNLTNWCSTEAEYTTLNASPDGIKGSCWNTGPNYNRWFKFKATSSNILVQMKTGELKVPLGMVTLQYLMN